MAWRSGSFSRSLLSTARASTFRTSTSPSRLCPSPSLLNANSAPSRRLLSSALPRFLTLFSGFTLYFFFYEERRFNSILIVSGLMVFWVALSRCSLCIAWWLPPVWLHTLPSRRELAASCLRVSFSLALALIGSFFGSLFVSPSTELIFLTFCSLLFWFLMSCIWVIEVFFMQ